jgi:cytochrome c-type biogenesis protein CcmE
VLKKKFLIGGLIIVLAVAYLGYTGFKSSATYYYTVSEVVEKGTSVYGEKLRVSGKVVADSVHSETDSHSLSFSLDAEGKDLPVVYEGIVPDTFRNDSDVVVEGRFDPSGVFQASTILTKCPSKYEPQQ